MVSTDLGACEWFVWDLRRSNLLDRGQLDQVIGEFLEKNPRAEPPALAEYLVGQGVLTPFQAERLLQGKTQGFVLGPFTLMDSLGSGSMGTVYKAQSKTDNKWYAVKVLPRRSMWNVRLAKRKVRAFEQCKHPTVVPFIDVGTSGGMHYLAWQLVEGETLDKVVQREGKLNPGLAAQFALQAAEGMDVIHQQSLFHGLIKPSNLMVGPNGELYILDCGIGTLLAETEGESLVDTMSTANSVTSGLDCASPESIMDPTNLTPAGDQYSLGCVLYYCVTGQFPFPEGTAAEKMMAHQFKEPASVRDLAPGIPDGLIAVVERLMQKKPEARYGSTNEVVEALRPFASVGQVGGGASSRSAAPPRPAPPSMRSNPAAPPVPEVPAPPPPRMDPEPMHHRAAVSAPLLPTRQSLRSIPAPPGSESAPVSVPRPPGLDEGSGDTEAKFGPISIIIIVVLVAGVAWLAMQVFMQQ